MSVAGVLYVYAGTLVLAGFLRLDEGVPVPGPAPLVPLATALGGVAALAALLATPAGPQPPARGERGFVRYMAAVHIGLLLPLGYAGLFAARAYVTRAFAHRAIALAGLSLASVVTFAWLVALKPKKKVD